MRLMLGIDTGGTFTDAVAVTAEGAEVVATAKAPTTHGDLVVGIEAALRAVLARPGVTAGAVGLVSLSTTLATNALVEGHGQPACLVTAGFGPAEVARIGVDPTHHDQLVTVAGGHDAMGRELAPVEVAELARVVAATASTVSAYAVATQFSVRNPAHELAIAEALAASGRPVTCSHELSPRLDGPRRALTTLLNARLIAIMAHLEAAVRASLAAVGVDAPLMMVRGDGSLASAAFLARRPIETILSGPAASVIGAHHLAGAIDGLVVDIGGTTTDIAPVRAGQPAIASDGAVVAGHRTMVEAVDLTTHGLGGDSEVAVVAPAGGGLLAGSPAGRASSPATGGHGPSGAEAGSDLAFSLGPSRAVPLSRLALDHPGVLDILGRQLAAWPVHGHGRLLVAVGRPGQAPTVSAGRATPHPPATVTPAPAPGSATPLATTDQPAAPTASDGGGQTRASAREQAVLAVLAGGPVAELDLATNRVQAQAVARLRRRGLIRVATFTPTDAARLLGHLDHGDLDAATLGAELLARQQDHRGRPVAASGLDLATRVQRRLIARSAECVLEAALTGDGFDGPAAVANPVVQAALAGRRGLATVTIGLTGPIAAVGASAATWYPLVAEALGTTVVLPLHAEVANAVGAVVGQIRVRRQATVTQPRTGSFRVHAGDQPQFFDLDQARAWAEGHLTREVTGLALAAGADGPRVALGWTARTALVNGRPILVEGTVSATATARPRLG